MLSITVDNLIVNFLQSVTLSLGGIYPIFPMRNKATTPLKVASCNRETGPSLTHSQSKPSTPSDRSLSKKHTTN